MTMNVASLVSGGGTTMESFAKLIKDGKLGDLMLNLVISSNPNAGAIKKAENLDITTKTLKDLKDPNEILMLFREYYIKIAVLNGYMPKIHKETIDAFINQQYGIILGQHPGIVRKDHNDFGGKGMYGHRPTAARVLYLLSIGAKEEGMFTESTVQHLDSEYDKGKSVGIIEVPFQGEMSIFKDKSGFSKPEQLDSINYSDFTSSAISTITDLVNNIHENLLLPKEHENVANVLKRLGNGEIDLKVDERYFETIVPEENIPELELAKKIAIKLYPNG